jgi:hypothetical protein
MLQVSDHRARPRLRRATVAAALLCATALGQPNLAYAEHGGGGGGGFHGGGGGFHGGGMGGFHGGGFGGFHGAGVGGFHGGGFGGFHGGFAGLHNGFGERHEGFRERHEGFGERHEGFRRGLGFGFYQYPYGWDYSPDYSYYGYSQPYSSQTWYYCWDPAGYYPYVTQCNTGWQAVPAS